MMENCKNCGTQLPGLARYCKNCGTKVEIPITYQYVEEDERDFAFHSEYYGAIGDYLKDVRVPGCKCTWYDDVLYELYKRDSQYYIVKIKEDGSVLDVLDLGKLEINFDQICSNRHGIFLVNEQCVFVYDFQGNKKHEIVFSKAFGEQYQVSDYYIFGSKIYVALYKKVGNVAVHELGMCVQVYDFFTNHLETVWSLAQGAEELEAFAKSQLRGQMEALGKEKNLQRAEQLGWQIVDHPIICANSQYAVIYYELIATPTDGHDYEVVVHPILLLDFKTGCCEDIKDIQKDKKGIEKMRLDLRRNRIWFPRRDNVEEALVGFPIQNWSEINLEQYEDIWRFNKGINFKECYFDGEHAYWADRAYCFYAYQKDGSRAVEWNCSGHGCTSCTVLGPYVYAKLDLHGGIFRHSIELPEEKCFDWNQENVDAIIRERKNKQIKADVAEEPEETENSEELEEPEEKCAGQEDDVSISGDIFDSMSILQLRTLLQDSSQYSNQFMTFRKNLKADKWDFNAVMGILLGSRKRHATGPRHIQEQNAGIGQGDNKDMVVFTLNQYGIMDIYEKYEKISNPDIKVAQAIRDICERIPKLTYICDAIRTILQ